MAAGCDQAVGHCRHPFCACFRIGSELNILSILNVKRASYCLNMMPLALETPRTLSSALNQEPTLHESITAESSSRPRHGPVRATSVGAAFSSTKEWPSLIYTGESLIYIGEYLIYTGKPGMRSMPQGTRPG
jgi:hypothetical protein